MVRPSSPIRPIRLAEAERLFEALSDDGYAVVALPDDSLHCALLALASSMVRKRCMGACPELAQVSFPPGAYHEIVESYQLDHSGLFPKPPRTFPWSLVQEEVDHWLTSPLRAIFPGLRFMTSGELAGDPTATYEPEVYFRLVRPHRNEDAVHPHVDSWSHGPIGYERRTLKIWIPLLNCSRGSSFRLMPGSHRRDWGHERELQKTPERPFNIPRLLPGQEYHLEEVVVEPPHVLLFHRKLLHGGIINHSEGTRYSAEATAIVDAPAFHALL